MPRIPMKLFKECGKSVERFELYEVRVEFRLPE